MNPTNTLTLNSQPFNPATSKVAVLGAGIMGPGIALVFAEAGYRVTMCEISPENLDKGMASLRDSVALKVSEGLLDDTQARQIIERVDARVGIEDTVAQADLVIEAVSEKKEIKQAVFQTVQKLAKPHTVIWSNTSTLNVFELIEPDMAGRLLVAHWFAPAHIVPLVEVVGDGGNTDRLVTETIDILKNIGKVPVRLNKMINGFVINRLQRLLGREIFYLLESGVISPEDLDIAVRASIAPRMQVLGVLQRYDFTNLNLSVRNFQDPDFTDPPFEAVPKYLQDRVNEGRLGVGTGAGFFDYQGRSSLEMQQERDRHLYRVLEALGEYVDGPRPVR
ncbi:3-hydroxyacyl-CoA dehydrogenase family protein [Advenella mandrilli]|nr:3-hydroxyacyl-CoA dehydrogenase family protein [Advenella mandrilli]